MTFPAAKAQSEKLSRCVQPAGCLTSKTDSYVRFEVRLENLGIKTKSKPSGREWPCIYIYIESVHELCLHKSENDSPTHDRNLTASKRKKNH